MKKNTKILEKPILLAVLPALVYLLAIAFEVGYLSQLNIPTSFLRIDSTVLTSSNFNIVKIIYFILGTILGIKSLLYPSKKIRSLHRKYRIEVNLLILLTIIFLLAPYETKYTVIILSLFTVSIFIMIRILSYIFKWKADNSKKFVNTIQHSVTKDDLEYKKLLDRLFEILFPIIILYSIAAMLGAYSARHVDEYTITKNNLAIVKQYGDYFIAREYKEDTIDMRQSIYILTVEKISKQSPLRKQKVTNVIFPHSEYSSRIKLFDKISQAFE